MKTLIITIVSIFVAGLVVMFVMQAIESHRRDRELAVIHTQIENTRAHVQMTHDAYEQQKHDINAEYQAHAQDIKNKMPSH